MRKLLLTTVLLLQIANMPQYALGKEPGSVSYVFDIVGREDSPLSLPTDVTVTPNYIVVVDSGNDRLVFFSKNGNYLFDVGKYGSLPGEFNAPVGIGSDKNGNIFVADTGNHRIQIFNLRGKFKISFPVVDDGEPIRPIDVTADSKSGLIFVTGNNNHKVMVYGIRGTLLNAWGGNGAEEGEFRYPATISLMSDNRVAVVDVLNTRVQVFKQDGEHSIQIGAWGVLPGQLFRPKGVAVDREHNVYISDSYLNVVQVFSDEGRFLHVLDFSSTDRPLETPTGIAVSEDHLYVVEMMANRVSVHRIGN